jgi:hypothetical protein
MSDRYQIKEKIGQGGLGEVFVAFDAQLQREVALKRVKATDGQASDDVLREAKMLSAVQHPNILTVFDVGQDSIGPFVVTELLRGETVEQMVARGPLKYEDFCQVAVQSLEGLVAAQAMNLVHRDLKPGNLMVVRHASGRLQIKILDFGLAKLSRHASRQTEDQESGIMGSIYFMAPEQFERLPLDGRTDLYALGCIFYHALTGVNPFDGETAPVVMAAHLAHTVTSLSQCRPDLPPWVCDWVMWFINRQPADRPSTAQDALDTFQQQSGAFAAALQAAPLAAVAAAMALVPPLPPRTRAVPGRPVASLAPAAPAAPAGPGRPVRGGGRSGPSASSASSASLATSAGRGHLPVAGAGTVPVGPGQPPALSTSSPPSLSRPSVVASRGWLYSLLSLSLLGLMIWGWRRVQAPRAGGGMSAEAAGAVLTSDSVRFPDDADPHTTHEGIAVGAGSTRLTPAQARIVGGGARPRESVEAIGHWTDLETKVVWDVVFTQVGEYEIIVVQSLDNEAMGGRYSVKLAGQTVSGEVQNSSSQDKFNEVSVGMVTVGKKGQTLLEIQPLNIKGSSLMNLGGVMLRKK